MRVTSLFLLLFWTGSGVSSRADADSRPNILFIAVDDLGNVLGSAGNPSAKTPCLDSLASSGVRFDRAYCQVPLCNPSRASVLTGLRPAATGVFDLSRHFRESLPDVVTLPQLFKNNGWFTARVGKIYHYDVPREIGSDGLDDKPSWDQVYNPKGRDVSDEARIFNPTPHKPVSAALSWLAADGADEEQTDGMTATETIRLLEQHQNEPFFIAAGFFRPHTPFVAPKKYFDLYPLENIQLPDAPIDDRADIPSAAFAHNNRIPNYGLPPQTCREALRGYLAAVSFVDAQIGRVLDELKRLGLEKNTIVVVWSDHGYHLGEHLGVWQKRTLFEESTRAPLLIRWPGAHGNGSPSRRVVEFVDIYATLQDLAHLPAPENRDGRSLRPLLEDPNAAWPYAAFSQVLRPNDTQAVMGRTIRTEQWRYTEWDEGRAGIELYDELSDPKEFVNLAGSNAVSGVEEDLRGALRKHIPGTGGNLVFDRKRL